jgi:hypothetical protein
MTTLSIRAALAAGVTAAMNKVGRTARCKPLSWEFQDRYVRGDQPDAVGSYVIMLVGFAGAQYDDDEAVTVATKWAKALALEMVLTASVGARVWQGTVDDLRIEVWCVSDRDAFEADTVARLDPGASSS